VPDQENPTVTVNDDGADAERQAALKLPEKVQDAPKRRLHCTTQAVEIHVDPIRRGSSMPAGIDSMPGTAFLD
jgi:hypothetical protein